MATALVTGASRGVGRGVALALAEAGYHVFGTGRTIQQANLAPSIVRIPTDHLRDDQTRAAFDRVRADADELDVLVNNASVTDVDGRQPTPLTQETA